MKILDKYIIRQYLAASFFIMGMIITIAVMIDFVERVDFFLDRKPPVKEIIFDYYLNFIPFWGDLLSPVCVFLGVIFFTSRMASRSEIIPMLGGGISFYRVFVPYLICAVFLAGVSFYFKGYLIPRATEERVEFEYKYFKKRTIHRKRDIHKKVAPDTYVYIGFYNEKRKEGHTFNLEQTKGGDIIAKIEAKRIIWVDSTESWRLVNARLRRMNGKKERMWTHTELDTSFLLYPDDIFIREEAERTKTSEELVKYIELEEMRGSDILKSLNIERHRRLSDPLAMIILTLIGFAMASRKSRGGIALQIGLGLFLCLVYVGLLFGSQAMVSPTFPAQKAVWIPNAIFLPIALFLMRVVPK
ncbi:MAG: LptF/LptG family permease [Bacteroidota bacterium]